MKKFLCKLCGYVHECESLEINYVCPVCGVNASQFEELTDEKEVNNRVKISETNPAIIRINEKCINCGQCKSICENQVGIKYDVNLCKEPICINCGQCIMGCPAGALIPKYNYKEVDDIITKNNKVVIAFTSPSVRVALGEEFSLPFGSFVEGKLVSALRGLGFNYVFDTTFGADITIVEEVNELVNRIKNNGVLPMFTSCCPSWIKYVEIYHPELIQNISSCKSPISMQSILIKEFISNIKGIRKDDIVTVAITPCTAKKMEVKREELSGTDYVITTSELANYLREKNIKFNDLPSSEYDTLMSRGSGSGLIFGNSGGVMEAALRTLNFVLTGENIDNKKLANLNIRGQVDIKEGTIKINNMDINIAVIYGMPALERFLKNMRETDKTYHFVEVMNCPGGCIGGGGQPLKAIGRLKEAREERIKALYESDIKSDIKYSHDNKDVQKVYNEFLGEIGGEKAHKMLHTEYTDKSSRLKIKVEN